MFTRSEFVAAGQPASRFSISQIRPFPQCAPPRTVEIYHLRNHGYSNYKRVVYKKLNSTGTLIQRTTMEASQQTYVLHRARRTQEDDQLLRKGCKRADSAGRDDSGDSYKAG